MPDESIRFKRRKGALDKEASTWTPAWRELTEFILPRTGRFLVSDRNKAISKRNGRIINPSATYALRTLSAGMMAGITSPARPWFKLGVSDPGLVENTAVKSWLYDVEITLRSIFGKSNLYKVLPRLYSELGTVGTGPMVIEEDFDDVIRCTNLTVGSYRLATNKYGLVDTLYRDYPMTVNQVVDKFGFKQCSQHVKELWNNKSYDEWVTVVHVIEPRKIRDHNLSDGQNMPIASVWFEKDSNEGKLLRESGFEENLIAAPRWVVDDSDVYGTGPGSDAIGEIKALQVKEREKAKAIAKVGNPPVSGPATLMNKPVSVLPGNLTAYDAKQGANKFGATYQINPDINAYMADINESERRISRAFYEDLFLMLSQSDRRQITAREVEERHEEKLLMLGPVLNRLDSELLDVIIDRTFSIANRRGLLPVPPEELQGKELKVEYVSILHQAQKSVAINAIDRLAGYVLSMADANPEVLDKFDFDQSIDEYAEALGSSPKLVRSDDDVAELRAARAEQQKQQQLLQASEQAASAAKDAAAADTSEKNALTDFLGGNQQQAS